MRRRRRWAAVASLVVGGAVAAGLAAYGGAQSAAAVGADRPHDERLNIRDTVYRGVDLETEEGPWGYSAASSDQGYSPPQPVAFPHPLHVQKIGMNCLYCHNNGNKSKDVGMPSVSTCMGCHQLVATNKPEVQRMARTYWDPINPAKRKPIPWVRIHKVPEYVHFPHMRHVNAGVSCQTCHGQVQKMNQVYQYASLNMGWCINCHVNGYDPAEGDRLAGYQRTANGYQPIKSAASGGESGAGISLVSTANAQSRPANPQVPSVPGGAATAGARKRARYDCSVCHY